MSTIYEVLEGSLRALDQGEPLESVLRRYPERARQLRPLLRASIEAREKAAKPEDLQAIRAQQLQRASRERAAGNRFQGFVPRFAVSLAITLMLLGAGAGLRNASAAALPGDNLYAVKRAWEEMQLISAWNASRSQFLENNTRAERLMEVSSLLRAGRSEPVEFEGTYLKLGGKQYVSGIEVHISDQALTATSDLQDGSLVQVTGRTADDASVTIDTISELQDGTAALSSAFMPTIFTAFDGISQIHAAAATVEVSESTLEEEFGSHSQIASASDVHSASDNSLAGNSAESGSEKDNSKKDSIGTSHGQGHGSGHADDKRGGGNDDKQDDKSKDEKP